MSQKWGARHIGEPHDHKSGGGLESLGPTGVYAYVNLWRFIKPFEYQSINIRLLRHDKMQANNLKQKKTIQLVRKKQV